MGGDEWVPLTAAAQMLGRRYRSTLDLVLLGKLKGEQDPTTRRWRVSGKSIAAMRERDDNAANAWADMELHRMTDYCPNLKEMAQNPEMQFCENYGGYRCDGCPRVRE